MARRAPQPWVRNRNHPAYKLLRWHTEALHDTGGWHCLRFDGACEGNGQPDATGGYGWTLHNPVGRFLLSGRGDVDTRPVTNNVAEWNALCAGLTALVAKLGKSRDWCLGLRIEGDSDLVVKGLSGGWKCQSRHMADWRDLCLDALADLNVPWTSEWIPRESNAECDALSKQFGS